jgi:uncharacterized protein (TIGR04141 family)
MSKYSTKIFHVEPSHFENMLPNNFINELIKKHNDKIGNNVYEEIDCTYQNNHFEQRLFIHRALATNPSWKNMLLEITNNSPAIKKVESKYPSFLLFFYSKSEIFVISGGAGYRVVESVLDSQFGFSVVERLINTSKHDIRGLSQRVFLGAELASNRYFKADYYFDDEDNFGKYYKGLDVFIDNNKLREIGIETNKKKLLVRGEQGFKIDTKITFSELVERINRISMLINDPIPPAIELNPFKKLTRWQLLKSYGKRGALKEILDKTLADIYFKSFQKKIVKDIYHPQLFEYLKCSAIKVKYGRAPAVSITTDQVITPRLIFGYLRESNALNIDLDQIHFPKFYELVQSIRISIYDDETGQELYPSYLIEWFFGEVAFEGKQYMKFENDWFDYSVRFSNDLNDRLEQLSETLTIEKMETWISEYGKESDYNDSYSQKSNFIVGDGRFHKWIEVADIISWNNDELIVYNIKNGLDRDLRILQSQIINSAKVISQLKSNIDSSDVSDYYEKLTQKASNLKVAIPSLAEFKDILRKTRVRFVFAFATTSYSIEKNEIIEELKATDSAIAKIAVLHSYYSIRQLGYEFSIAKIIKED